ncbi:uncharacterized protein LOC132749908 isoform X1 [Ruditapes philippinarum]|uniref:uncharacterized protein LOC132749908 isoform X1 n=1 Tax=Ruditapes philippinarum TaxID=129788 RepID=UPI00295BEF20|nr:uncharacterized protein LOC132749908 isoform X1 [Ruditapes philippinarum]
MENQDSSASPSDFQNVIREINSTDDVGMELEPPEDGSTLQQPPNGGRRAWRIVMSCLCINGLIVVLRVMIYNSLTAMSIYNHVPGGTLNEIGNEYPALVPVYSPLAAYVMISRGYRKTVCIGAGIVMVTMIILSLLEGNAGLIKFLMYGPIAIGISFIEFGGLIPVLEYFTTKRMAALFLSRLGPFIAAIILTIISIFEPGIFTASWRDVLRGPSGICVGIWLFGMTLKELKLAMRDDESATFVQRTFGVFNKSIFKNVLFWSTCIVYFFYQWGIETPKEELKRFVGMGDSLPKLLTYAFSAPFGLILGKFLAWIFNKMAFNKKSGWFLQNLEGRRLTIIFGVLAASTVVSSIGCFIAPSVLNFGYFTTFSLLFSTFHGFCEAVRDNLVPEVFGRENTKVVEGFILMLAGIGAIINREIIEVIHNDYDWKTVYRYGGGMLMLSSVVTIVVVVVDRLKARQNSWNSRM